MIPQHESGHIHMIGTTVRPSVTSRTRVRILEGDNDIHLTVAPKASQGTDGFVEVRPTTGDDASPLRSTVHGAGDSHAVTAAVV